MSAITGKVADANRVIDQVLANYRRPAVMWSSGKDSMVLLFLLRARQIQCPVIFHRQPFMAHKYEFADRIIREWGLSVHDYPPAAVAVAKRNGHLSLLQQYQVGPQRWLGLPLDLYEPPAFNGEPFVCGLREGLNRPTGTYSYPWDCAFVGHKASDVDPLLGPIPVAVDVKQNTGAPAFAFPLRQWTDADIWDYSWRYEVPQQDTRYDKGTGEENPDRRMNPDWFQGCTRCLDPDGPAQVFCPKLKMGVNNLAREGQVAVTAAPAPEYCAPVQTSGRETKEVQDAV